MTDVKKDMSNIVNKTLTLNNSKILPKNRTWKLVIFGGIGLAVVLVLLFIAFFIKTLVYVVTLLVVVIVIAIIGIGVVQWQSKKE